MYTARLLSGLGQTSERGGVLEDAITYALKQARYAPFPTGTWTVSPTQHQARVAAIMMRANDTKTAAMAFFTPEEVKVALTQRGYRSGSLPGASTETVVPPAPLPIPSDSLVNLVDPVPEPVTYPPAAPILVQTVPQRPTATITAFMNQPTTIREPLPGGFTLPIIVPPSPQFPEVIPPEPLPGKSNWFLWAAGLLTLYALGKADNPHHRSASRSSRRASTSGRSLGGTSAQSRLLGGMI